MHYVGKMESSCRARYELFLRAEKLTTLYKYCREHIEKEVMSMWQQVIVAAAVAVVSAIAKEIIEER